MMHLAALKVGSWLNEGDAEEEAVDLESRVEYADQATTMNATAGRYACGICSVQLQVLFKKWEVVKRILREEAA